MAFSMTHEFIYSTHDHHSSVHEYVHEITTMTDHGDSCDLHFMLHLTYPLPERADGITWVHGSRSLIAMMNP